MLPLITKIAALYLSALGIPTLAAVLSHFASLIVDFMEDFFGLLRTLTAQQRRVHPGYVDVLLLLREFLVMPSDLAFQIRLGKSIRQGPLGNLLRNIEEQAKIMAEEANAPAGPDELDKCDKDFQESLELVPLTQSRKPYIPSHMPPFPPDHTYRYTEVYTKKVLDPKELRQLLVEEGNAALVSLLKLGKDEDGMISPPMSDEEKVILEELDGKEPQEPEIKKEAPQRSTEEALKSLKAGLTPKPLDLEKYARERLAILERRRKKIVDPINKIRKSQREMRYLYIYKHLSPYDSHRLDPAILEKPTAETTEVSHIIDELLGIEINMALNAEYAEMMKTIEVLKKVKEARIKEKIQRKREEELEKRRKAQEEREAKNLAAITGEDLDFDNFEFGFEERELGEQDVFGEEDIFGSGKNEPEAKPENEGKSVDRITESTSAPANDNESETEFDFGVLDEDDDKITFEEVMGDA